MSQKNDERRNWHGANWIRKERRLAIYLRDGMACQWCGAGVEEDGVVLSLDHLVCDVKGGGHESTNLVTSCTRCNSARGKRSVSAFARAVAEHSGRSEEAKLIERRVRNTAKRMIRLIEAKLLLARRLGHSQAYVSYVSR